MCTSLLSLARRHRPTTIAMSYIIATYLHIQMPYLFKISIARSTQIKYCNYGKITYFRPKHAQYGDNVK